MRFGRLIFVSLIFCLIISPSKVFAFSGSGGGTAPAPYQIATCSQLHEIASDLTAFYLLKNDVNCNGFSFSPIGDTTSNFFTGTLDGGGHKITNLTINSDENAVAIFEQLGTGGVITNIGYESGSVTGGEDTTSIGSFVGKSSGGSITKSYSKVNLDGTAAGFIDPTMGGLIGQANSVTISDSYYSGSITNGTASPNYTAGIAGYLSSSSIANSYSTGSTTNGQNVGGLVGRLLSSSTITNSFSTMTFINASTVGALVGTITSGTISNSYWNDTSGGFMTCYFGGNTGCNRISNNIPYFYTITNSPMNSWDFVNTWSVNNNGTTYPVLAWQSPNPTPTPVPGGGSSPENLPSNVPTSCTSSAPMGSPNLFKLTSHKGNATLYFAPVSGQNTAYTISYGFTPAANQYATTFNYGFSSGVIPYTINYLFPATWYFKVSGLNNCMPGSWSQTQSVNVK